MMMLMMTTLIFLFFDTFWSSIWEDMYRKPCVFPSGIGRSGELFFYPFLENTEMGYILLKLAQVFCSRHVGLIFPNCSCSVVLVQGNPSCKVLKDCKDYGWLTLDKLLEEQSCYSIWLGILMKKSPNLGYPIQSRVYIYTYVYIYICYIIYTYGYAPRKKMHKASKGRTATEAVDIWEVSYTIYIYTHT